MCKKLRCLIKYKIILLLKQRPFSNIILCLMNFTIKCSNNTCILHYVTADFFTHFCLIKICFTASVYQKKTLNSVVLHYIECSVVRLVLLPFHHNPKVLLALELPFTFSINSNFSNLNKLPVQFSSLSLCYFSIALP